MENVVWGIFLKMWIRESKIDLVESGIGIAETDGQITTDFLLLPKSAVKEPPAKLFKFYDREKSNYYLILNLQFSKRPGFYLKIPEMILNYFPILM